MINDAIRERIWSDCPNTPTLKRIFVFQNESSSNAALDGLYLSWSEIPKPHEVLFDTQTIQFCMVLSEIFQMWVDM